MRFRNYADCRDRQGCRLINMEPPPAKKINDPDIVSLCPAVFSRRRLLLDTDPSMQWIPLLILLWVWPPGEGWSQEVDIPLTVSETAGLARHQYPITSGIPLPRGLLKSAAVLQLMDPQGRFVPAAIQELARWPEDGSLRWIQVHFAASLPANGRVVYFLRQVGALPRFPSPIGLSRRREGVEVVTGPLRMVMGGQSQQLLDQVWVDENWGYDFSARTRILESGHFRIALRSGGVTYGMGPWSENRVEVEEANAVRAVIKVSGTFVSEDGVAAPFDYVARVTVYGGKTYFKLDLTLIRPCGSAAGEFPLEDFSVEAKLNLDPFSRRFALGGGDGDHQGHFDRTSTVSLYLDSADSYRLSGVEGDVGASGGSIGRERPPQPLRRKVPEEYRSNLGWADLADDRHGLALGVKWFWQLYPKAFEIRKSGSLIARLFPEQAEPQNLPPGGSRTHQLLFYFHGRRSFAEGRVKNALMGLQKPIHAFAPPSWYCRASQAFGPLSESSPEVYREGYWPLVQKVDGWMAIQRESLVAGRRDRRGPGGSDGYGWLRFGGGRPGAKSPQPSPEGIHWSDDRTYALAYGLYLHFFRTGDARSLEVAEEVVSHWADLGVSHSRHPGSRGCAPGAWGGRRHESLLHSFLLTGNRRALDAARSWLEQAVAADGVNPAQAPRHAVPVLVGLVKGYQILGEERYLERARWIVEVIRAWHDGDLRHLRKLSPEHALRWEASRNESRETEAWENGELWWALHRNRRWLGRDWVEDYLQRSAGPIRSRLEEWVAGSRDPGRSPEPGIGLAPGLAAIYESGGDPRDWELALKVFARALKGREASQPFPEDGFVGAAQHFLWYLSREFDPP